MVDKMIIRSIVAEFNYNLNFFEEQEVAAMKKIGIFLVLTMLLVSMIPAVSAAGSAYLSGPSVIRAGETVSITFCAGGGILGGSGSISYDKAQLTLQSYSSLLTGSWEVEFNGDQFVFYDNSTRSPMANNTPVFKATFTVNSTLATGAALTVSAAGVTLTDGKQDMSVGTCTYTKTVSPPMSANANLATLSVANATISPAFSPDVTIYNASVPYSVSSLKISATAADTKAKVSVGSAALKAGGITTVSITVTAENGSQKVYNIRVTREQDPNYVKSTNANLKELKAEGYVLSPAFSEDVTKYYLWLPYETEKLKLSAAAEDKKASVQMPESVKLEPGKATELSLTVTAEDGSQKVYTVMAFRAPAHENVEDFLNGEAQAPTVPPTEPATQPPTVPATETVPAPTEGPVVETPQLPWSMLVVTGLICATIGAGIGVAIMALCSKKKNKE